MNRAKDLDTIAPDDLDPVSTPPSPSNTNTPKPKKAKVKSTKNSKDDIYRQRVYELIKGKTKSPFSAFLARPKVFDFEERQEEEEIILVLRQHWFTNVSWVITAIVMVLIPIAISIFELSFFNFFSINYFPIFALFWYLITSVYVFEKFLSWYFNVYIITDERIIDIDFNNLINKKFSEAKIDKIQDITSKVSGIFQTMLNYGNVFIQTAAEVPEIEFGKVPSPEVVIKVLQLLRQEEETEVLEGRIR